ncbi:MAG TPA: GNAT family N-acetyltransferase [Phycisphaerae bacterium]|nr:GNAT family N-acetyltransferase [Phycisphaerae bacterium]
MTTFRPSDKAQVREALAALLERPGLTRDEIDEHIDVLLRYLERRGISLEHLVVTRQDEMVMGACLRIEGAGRMSTVFIPTESRFLVPTATTVALLEELSAEARRRNVQLLQATVVPEAALEAAVYREAGFERLAQLICMDSEAARITPPDRTDSEVQWLEHDTNAHGLFARVVQSTYERSLDCVALNGVRDMEDILASHKAAGEFDPRFWLIASVDGEPAGVILLSRQPERWALEVVYMGVVPSRRGRGCGAAMLRRAFKIAREQALETLTLTVDAGNMPALGLYRRFGFTETGRRDVWIRKL